MRNEPTDIILDNLARIEGSPRGILPNEIYARQTNQESSF
jgi:hypothetical protein